MLKQVYGRLEPYFTDTEAEGQRTGPVGKASGNANWRNNAKQDHLGVKRKLHAAAIQQRFYSVPFARKSCLAEKSRTAPKKGTKTHPAFASGTTRTC
jgi:hypothetical protein